MQRNPRPCLWLFLLLLQIFPGASSRASITVVSYWRLGENDAGAASGVAVTDTIDIAGTNNLTFQGPAYYTNDVAVTAAIRTDSSLSVNFTNGAYATNSIVSTARDNFGIECWVKPTALGGGQVIAYNGITGGAGDGGWGIIIAADNTYEALFGGVVGFGTNVATANVWTHLALVRNGATATLYINGAAVATDSTDTPGIPTGNFALASHPQSPAGEFFTGLVDEVRVFTFAPGQFSTNDLLFNTPAFVQSNTPLPGLAYGVSIAWGDYDNDGLMDILLCGSDFSGNLFTQVWRNTGNGFTNINAGLPGIEGTVAWGDYDNDGRRDILLCGYDGSGPITQVWRNTGSGFTNINAGLPGVEQGSAAWGDYDNDGRLDILLCGYDGSGPITQVWRNTGNGFTNINAGLPGVELGSAVWGDYDNDGRLDILLNGDNGSGDITQVWRNTGSGFTNINAGLPGVEQGSVAWGDYDNDGRLDILLCGDTGFAPITQIWRNTGSGFTNINAGLPGVEQGSAAWGDYDNDGRLDILLCGFSGVSDESGGPIAQVWRNTGSGFINIDAGLPGVEHGSAAWGDYNNDGRLDFLISGSYVTQLWLNQFPTTNSPPTVPPAPTGLSAAFVGSSLTLSWNASSGLQTPVSGLSYNLRVGTTPGGSDILAPMADTNGMRLLPQRGSIQGTQLTLQLPSAPPLGSALYCSVQSIDTSFAGSPFASFVVPPFFTSSGLTSDGTFEAQFNVHSGINYTIQASTDLVHWVDLLDFSFDGSGPFLFTDPDAANYPQRFYRFGQH